MTEENGIPSTPKSRRKTVTHDEFQAYASQFNMAVAGLKDSVRDVMDSVRSLASTQADSIRNLTDSHRELQNNIYSELRQSQKPQYSTWLQAIGLATVIAGGMWALLNSQMTALKDHQIMGDEAVSAKVEHLEHGTNRFSIQDFHREKQERIDEFRHREMLLNDWQKLQDEKILANSLVIAKMEEWQRIHEQMLAMRGEWIQREQEKTNRLDEKARYHMELDDPTDIRPADVFNELQRLKDDLNTLEEG